MKLYSSLDEDIKQLSGWKMDALKKFSRKMMDKKHKFPCIPATQAHALNHLRYGFVGSFLNNSTSKDVAQLLKAFTQNSRDYGSYATLIVFFDTPKVIKETCSVEDFETAFWSQIRQLTEHDEMNWPAHIPIDPYNNGWEFCFHGEPYFMYCATPSHERRDSRSFPYFMMAITPRWVLREFYSNEKHAGKIKNKIRERMIEYDCADPHPDLKKYGDDDNYEWRQYFLRDDDTAISHCPFHQMLNERLKK
ncbi:YqcI/YcgG family protein [Halobacillus sp. Marseille-Q1614]|uniref:YqcI/YcgG family protein n=1 Tax=Halobacillus sp. Marseille-Q1614 TaxID=2709134 RepID=UPI00156DF546|nr:YqcI/YcgG family protein [Halobacillus sp. Marseille-Q1614]